MTPAAANLRIDPDRLWDSIHEIARIGPGRRGGSNRQALTDADGEARHLFAGWCRAAGLSLAVDRMGTMFATRPGTDPDALPVCVGSHLDTQPTGGRYDGVLGVLAGLELVRTLNDLDLRTRRPICVVNWTNEEGTRFAPALMASGVYAGMHDLDWALSRTDAEGRRFGDELARIGWQGDEPVGARRMHAYFELHIEQGPILEAEGCEIGVVTHGQGLWWLRVVLTGREAHTGSTPMAMRHDAGLGMARIIERVNRIAMDSQPDAVGSVGQVQFHPNSPNVIPGRAECLIDFRSPDPARLDAMKARLEAEAAEIAREAGLGLDIEPVGHFAPVTFDPGLVARVRAAAAALGYRHRDIVSGAGHDACAVAMVAPAAMIFCPCAGGLSHNEDESITREWAAAGANVLLRAAVETAGIVA
ncbi:MAG: Zn-dependent hydrolase [Paracoccaceae bacterium]|nr:MAG: Zn-dependent hydrolase [Paracoccaceae bacterium]